MTSTLELEPDLRYEFYTLQLSSDIIRKEFEKEDGKAGYFFGIKLRKDDLLPIKSRFYQETIYETCLSLRQQGWKVNLILYKHWKGNKLAILCSRKIISSSNVPSILSPANIKNACRIIKENGRTHIEVIPSIFYKRNPTVFVSEGISGILQEFIKRSISYDIKGLPELDIVDASVGNPYVFSDTKNFGLRPGKVLSVEGSQYAVEHYYRHTLNGYTGRVLWIGHLPSDKMYDQMHQINIENLRFNFIENHHLIDNSPLIDYMSNIVENVAKVGLNSGIMRTILSEIAGKGVLKNKGFAERIHNIRDHKESHSMRDDFGQLVSVLFDGFKYLNVLDAWGGEDISSSLKWKRHLLSVESRNDLFLILGFLLFFTNNHKHPYDLVIINDHLLSHIISRSTYRDKFPPLLEQLQSISPTTRFLLTIGKTDIEPRLVVGNQFNQMGILIYEEKNYHVSISNLIDGQFIPYIPKEENKININAPLAKPEEFLNDFDEFYKKKILGFPERKLTKEDLDDFKNRLDTEVAILQILQEVLKAGGDFMKAEIVRDAASIKILGAMKVQGLLRVEKIGLSDNSEVTYLTEKGERYLPNILMKLSKFYSEFNLDLNDIARYIRELKYNVTTGNDRAKFHADTSNFFLNLHIQTYWKLLNGKDVDPLSLALSNLWTPELSFKDPIIANGFITSRRFTSLITEVDLKFGKQLTNKDEIEAHSFTPLTPLEMILPTHIESSEHPEEIFENPPNSESDETNENVEGEIESFTYLIPEIEESEENIEKENMSSHHENNAIDEIHGLDKPSRISDEEMSRDQQANSSFDFLHQSTEKKNWNFYRNLPGVELSPEPIEIKQGILELPLFRFVEGALADRLMNKASNLTLGNFQKLKDQINFKRDIGLTQSQINTLMKLDIVKSGTNLNSFLPSLDEYARYTLILYGSHLNPDYLPRNVIQLIPPADQIKLESLVNTTSEPMNYILPVIDFLFLEWGKMMKNKEISPRLESKYSMLMERIIAWKEVRTKVDILNLKNYALINNILMLFQEIFGGLFIDRVNKELLAPQIPDPVLRDLIVKSNRIHHIVTFNLGYIYRIMNKLKVSPEDENLINELKEEVLRIISRVIIWKT